MNLIFGSKGQIIAISNPQKGESGQTASFGEVEIVLIPSIGILLIQPYSHGKP